MTHLFDIFVPAARDLGIAPGSGIVGRNDGDGITLDYEGNLYHAGNIKTWADRVYHAAGRAAVNYPTVARRKVAYEDVLHVGFYASGDQSIEVASTDLRETVCKWLGIAESELDAQLVRSGR